MSTPQKILIVEDETIVSMDMELVLGRNGYDCKAVSTGEAALDVMEQYAPDIILMDIGLGGDIDGITTAGILRRQYRQPVIFITRIDDHPIFQQAGISKPENYLTKPYTDAALLRAVHMGLSRTAQPPDDEPSAPIGSRVTNGIFVFSGTGYEKVFFTDILYLEAMGMSTILHCVNKKVYKVAISSNNLAMELDYPSLVKSSRSCFVNIQKIDRLEKEQLIVGGATVALGKKYKADIVARLKKISQNP